MQPHFILKGSDTIINIYTDGSFADGNYAWAFVAYKKGIEFYRDFGLGKNEEAKSMRQVAGELNAVIQAYKWAKDNGYKNINIFYDYVGVEAWVSGGWKANNKFTRMYAEYLRKPFLSGELKFFKVSSHSGNVGNERADFMCKMAFKERECYNLD